MFKLFCGEIYMYENKDSLQKIFILFFLNSAKGHMIATRCSFPLQKQGQSQKDPW